MPSYKEVAIVVGASRGIGRQIAVDLAKDGYAVVVAAKTTSDASKCTPFPPDPNSNSSTINTVVREITEAGGEASAIQLDVRDFGDIQSMVDQTAKNVEKTPMKRFQLMQRINPEGFYGCVQACLPYMYQNGGKGKGRIVVVSPPIYRRFLKGKTAYAMGKWAMSALTMGLSVDFEREGRTEMAITSLWTGAAINSAATQGAQTDRTELRKPTIFSDAVRAILKAPPSDVSGRCLVDDVFLREHEGIQDLSKYSLVPGATPRRMMPARFPDLRVEEEDDEGNRMDSTAIRAKI
ncbi:hypothetical protein D0860_00391 [Hortaea werneckii]|uniref:Short chain dehydrogenase n=1 Tax=Hortaea werneckii TaxID=91943 RepID=A0A3M7HWB4_HORWE|nr:hypothetical protein D0860_00391 [Hortaea werneckii]